MIVLLIAWLIVLIYHIIQVVRNPEVPFMMKILWPFIMFIAPVIGIVVYYIIGKHEKRDDGSMLAEEGATKTLRHQV